MLSRRHPGEKQCGFSLLEMILAMLMSSIMIVSVAAIYPQLQRQSMDMYRLYRLEQAMRQVLLTLEKDLRRAGFLFADGQTSVTNSVRLGAHPQSAANSCVIIQYDLNYNGAIEPPSSSAAEQFGYRLLSGAIEQSRGEERCDGKGWDKLLDPSEIVITQFLIEWHNAGYYVITLDGHWAGRPDRQRRLIQRVKG